MQNIQGSDSHQFSSHPTSPSAVNSCSRSWWNSSVSQIPPSSMSRSTSLNVDTPPQHCQNANQLGSQGQDQDSSSSQSTIQSHHEMATIGYDETNGRQEEPHVKSFSTQATPYFSLPPPQIDFNQSSTHLPYPYADPYYGAMMAAYGAPTIMLPDMVGNPTRASLPLEVADAGPIFVNAKQYHGILRRRQTRAKLEAQNSLVKPRKPYLHESRHLHAVKRVRGSGGRFLKQQSDSSSQPYVENTSELASRQTSGNLSESEIRKSEITYPSAPTTSCSDTTCLPNNEAPERLLSGYNHPQRFGTTSSQDSGSGGSNRDDMTYNGYQQFGVPITR